MCVHVGPPHRQLMAYDGDEAGMISLPNAVLRSGQRLRRWPNITPALCQRLVFFGSRDECGQVSPLWCVRAPPGGSLVQAGCVNIAGRRGVHQRRRLEKDSSSRGRHHGSRHVTMACLWRHYVTSIFHITTSGVTSVVKMLSVTPLWRNTIC